MASRSKVELGRADVIINGDDSKLRKAVDRASASLAKLGKDMQKMGFDMVKFGAALAVPLSLAVKGFATFDDQMRATQAVTQATGKDLDMLTEKALELGRTTSFTATQVASAMTMLGRAGFKAPQIEKMIPSVLNLSRATGTDLAEAAETASNTLRRFELNAKDAAMVADILTATVNNSAQTLTDLEQGLNTSAPIIKEYGLSLQDAAKMLGALANFGIKGSRASMALKKILLQFSDPTVRDSIRNVLKDVDNVDLANVSQTLSQLGTAMQKMPRPERLNLMRELFGERAIAAGIKLTKDGFEGLNKAIDNFNGTSAKAADDMDKGLGGFFRKLWSAIDGIGKVIGGTLDPALQGVAWWITELTNKFSDYLKSNKWLVGSLAVLAGALLVVGSAFVTLGTSALFASAIMAKWPLIIANVVKALVALKGTMLFLLTNPYALAIMAIVAAVMLLTKHMRRHAEQIDGLRNSYAKLREEQEEHARLAAANEKKFADRVAKATEGIKEAEAELARLRKEHTRKALSDKDKEIAKAQDQIDKEKKLIETLKNKAIEEKKAIVLAEGAKEFTALADRGKLIADKLLDIDIALTSDILSEAGRKGIEQMKKDLQREANSIAGLMAKNINKVAEESQSVALSKREESTIQRHKEDIAKRGKENLAKIDKKYADIAAKEREKLEKAHAAKVKKERDKLARAEKKHLRDMKRLQDQREAKIAEKRSQRARDLFAGGKVSDTEMGQYLVAFEEYLEEIRKWQEAGGIFNKANKGGKPMTFEEFVKSSSGGEIVKKMVGGEAVAGGFLASRFREAGSNVDTQKSIEQWTKLTAENTSKIARKEGGIAVGA